MTTSGHTSYEDGLRDGKLEALAKRADGHDRRFLDHEHKFMAHETRFRAIERLMWLLMGAIAFMNFYPAIKSVFGLP